MTFRKRRKRNDEPIEVMLRNISIPSKNSAQVLGITLDSRLNWEEHINKLRAKVKRALNTIREVAEKKWGIDWKILKKLYSEICRTTRTMAANTDSAGRLKKLDSIHREGIRIYTEAFRTSLVVALHVETNDQSLELRRKNLGLRFLYKH